MRGAQQLTPNPVNALRIIPADAGSTDCRWVVSYAYEDHPRGCGEHKGGQA